MRKEIQDYLNNNITNIDRFNFDSTEIIIYMKDGTEVLFDAHGAEDGEIDVFKINR